MWMGVRPSASGCMKSRATHLSASGIARELGSAAATCRMPDAEAAATAAALQGGRRRMFIHGSAGGARGQSNPAT